MPPEKDPAEITDPAPVVADPAEPIVPVEDPPSYADPDATTVPLARFQEQGQEIQQEREARQQLETQLDGLNKRYDTLMARLDNPSKPTPDSKDALPGFDGLPEAPKDFTNLQAAYWHIREGLKRDLPQLLRDQGVPLDQLKSVDLEGMQATAMARTYIGACAEAGIDAANGNTRLAYAHLVEGGMEPQKAAAQLKENGAPEPKRSATPITSGSSATAGVENIMPRDSAHAGALAAKGTRIPNYGINDVLAARKKQRAAGTR